MLVSFVVKNTKKKHKYERMKLQLIKIVDQNAKKIIYKVVGADCYMKAINVRDYEDGLVNFEIISRNVRLG